MELDRAYSLLEIKAATEDGEARIITGIASTPTPDRMGDIVDPKGASFKLPIPLLWQHDSTRPIGHVTAAKITDKGIEVTAKMAQVPEAGPLKDHLDFAWQSVKSGLVRGLSIGFRALKALPLEDPQNMFARHIKEWLWLELSAVTIPANGEATITQIKAIDTEAAAALGKKPPRTVRLLTKSGVAEKSTREELKGALAMKTIAETISALEATRAAKLAASEALLKKSAETDETMSPDDGKEFDDITADIKLIDDNLARYRTQEKLAALSAKPVVAKDEKSGSDSRDGRTVSFQHSFEPVQKKHEPGIGFVRMLRCLGLAQGNRYAAMELAKQMFGESHPQVVGGLKATVAAGTTLSGNWGEDLIGDETGLVAEFLEYLRPMTILGKFGTGGIPSLNTIPFRVPFVTQTVGMEGYWVGEGNAKPLTKGDFDRSTLEPLKVANICALSMELIRDSRPSAEAIVRRDLVAALSERMDKDFINPDKAASAGISPAGILNGVSAIPSSGGTIDAIFADIAAVMGAFIDASNPPSSGVWVMSQKTALKLSLIRNPLGAFQFGGINMGGGTFEGFPVITSEYVTPNTDGDFVALINARDIFFADEGGFQVDMSDQATLEMSDAPTHNSGTPSGSSSLVSMWQTNSVAFRAERTVNWKRARASAVAWLSNVNWTGAT